VSWCRVRTELHEFGYDTGWVEADALEEHNVRVIHHAHELDLRAEFLEALGVVEFLYSHRLAIVRGLIYIRIGT
jgi:hypothetical protein